MPLIPTKTKSIIGTIIDPELEDQLDNDTLLTQLKMLNNKNKQDHSLKTLAQENYLKEIKNNISMKNVKSPRNQRKNLRFGKNNVKEFFKHLPPIIVPPKLKRTHTRGGKQKTRKTRKTRK
jgi:hypothetical protein